MKLYTFNFHQQRLLINSLLLKVIDEAQRACDKEEQIVFHSLYRIIHAKVQDAVRTGEIDNTASFHITDNEVARMLGVAEKYPVMFDEIIKVLETGEEPLDKPLSM